MTPEGKAILIMCFSMICGGILAIAFHYSFGWDEVKLKNLETGEIITEVKSRFGVEGFVIGFVVSLVLFLLYDTRKLFRQEKRT